jgi:hypothetical protein
VIDRNGAALEGAQVALTGPPGSPVRTVQCGNNGQFEFTGLTPDIYKLAVIAPGMSTFTSPEIALHAGEFRILPPVSLSVSPVTTTVIVNAGRVSNCLRSSYTLRCSSASRASFRIFTARTTGTRRLC